MNEQEAYWNFWQKTRSSNSWSLKRAEKILDIIASLPLENPEILDFGCGNGWFTERLSHYGRATGIDLSKAGIKLAKENYPSCTFIAADILEYHFPPENFDVIVSQQVIAHVENQIGYLDRTADALKANGYLILSSNNKFIMDRIGDSKESQPFGHIEKWLSRRVLERLLRNRFLILRTQSIIPVGNKGILRLVNSHKLNKIACMFSSKQKLESLKERFGLGYINLVLAQKK